MPEQQKTVTLELTERDLERLERLRLLTTADNDVTVFTSALGVADELVGRVLRGEEFMTRRRDGSMEYLEFSGLKSASG